MFLGNWEIDDFITFVCNTHDPADGAGTDADGVATYRVYEDETGTPILTGSMALFDAANTVGFYSERIQLTAANGFEVGKHYTIYITATVDSIAGTMSHNFQVDNKLAGIESKIDTIDTNVDAILVDTGTDIPASLATIDTNVDAILVDTGTDLPATLSTIEGKIDTIDGIVDSILVDTGTTLPGEHALLATQASVDTIDANVDAILVDTGTTIPATLAGLATQASVDVIDGIVDDILVDTGTTLPGEHALLATQASVDTIDSNVDAILVDTGTTIPATLTTIEGKIDTIDTVVDAIKVVTDALPDGGALTTIDSNIDAILVDTGTTLPAEHALLATQASVDTIDSNVDAILVDTSTTLPGEHAALSSEHASLATAASIAALNDLSSADVQTVLETNDLDHIAKVAHPTGDPVADTLFDLIMNKDVSQTFDRSTDSLEGQTDGAGTPPTAAVIADAVWDEAIGDHTGGTTFGGKNQNLVPSETIGDYKADVSGLATQASVDAIDVIVDAIKAVTDNLPDSGQLLDLALILTDTGTTLPAEHALLATAASIAALNDLSSADVAAELATYDGPTRAEATSDKNEILADTGSIEGKVDTISTNVDAILVDTGTDIPATLASIEGKVDTIDTVVDAIKAVTDNLPDSGQLLDLALILTDTGTTLPAQIAALNDLAASDIQTVLETNDLDHLAKVAHPSGDPVADTLFDLVMNKDGSQTFDRSTDSLEGIADSAGTPPTAAAIADAVWDEDAADHTTADTFGDKNQNKVPSETINDYKADVSALATQASVDTIDANVDAILVDTGTTLPATLATIEGKIDTIDGNVDSILVDTGTTLPAEHALLATAASIAALNDLSSADIQTVLEDNDLDHLLKIAHPTGDPVASSIFDLVMNKDGSQTFDRSTDSLEGLADGAGSPPSAAAIADAVWDEDIADHTTSTKFGGKNQKVVPSETLNDYKADVSGLATSAALATVDSNVDAILVDTGTTLPAEHAALSGQHGSLATAASIAALNDLAAADIQTVLETNDLDHLAKVAHPTGTPTIDSLFDLIMNKDGSQTFSQATDALEAIADAGGGGAPTVQQIVDGVWDELLSAHTGGTSFGGKNQLGVPSETLNDYKADVSGLATSAALATHDAKLDTVDTIVDAIKAVTDLLPDGGALTTIDSNIDAILVDTGTTIPATLAGLATAAALATVDANVDLILVDTNELQTDWTNGGRLDLILDGIVSDTGDILSDIGALTSDVDDLSDDVSDVLVDTSDILSDTSDILDDTAAILAAIGGGPPAGAITFTYNLTSTAGGQPIADADVWVTTDIAGTNTIASGRTDQYGNVTFYLDAGTVYVWSQKTGFNFDNPDTEVIV